MGQKPVCAAVKAGLPAIHRLAETDMPKRHAEIAEKRASSRVDIPSWIDREIEAPAVQCCDGTTPGPKAPKQQSLILVSSLIEANHLVDPWAELHERPHLLVNHQGYPRVRESFPKAPEETGQDNDMAQTIRPN